jgi:hypothetical protein
MGWINLAGAVVRCKRVRRSSGQIDVRLMAEIGDGVRRQDLVIVPGDPSSDIEDHVTRAHIEPLPIDKVYLTPSVLESKLISIDGCGEVDRGVDRILNVHPELFLGIKSRAVGS